MDERKRFQFSVGNLMLSMVPLAVLFGLASRAGAVDVRVWIALLYVGLWPAAGALVDGWRGMLRGLGWFVVGTVVVGVLLELIFMLSLYIEAIAGVTPATPEGWSVAVAAVLLGVGPAIGAVRGGWRSAQVWSVGWSAFVTACIVIAMILLAIVRGFGGR